MPIRIYFGVMLLVATAVCPASFCEEPVGWRNDGTGHFRACQPPTSWSLSEQIAWKSELPAPSYSSPVVVGDRIFVMAEPAELICASATDGKILWKQSHTYAEIFPAEQVREIETQHAAAKLKREEIEKLQKQLKEAQDQKAPATTTQPIEAQITACQQEYEALTPYPPPATDGAGNATSTPVSDGQRVWTTVANGIVACRNLDGKRNWMSFIEKPAGRHTSSPLLVDGTILVHFKDLIALDAETGDVRWKTESTPRNGTPAIVRLRDTLFVATPGGDVIRVADGERVATKLFDLAYCSPTVDGDVLYSAERGKLKATQLVAKSDGTIEPRVLWEIRGAEDDRLASPVVHDGLFYSITSKGILDVVDAKAGKPVYRKRLEFGDARADPSLVVAGNMLFVSSNNGTTWILRPGREYQEVGRNELEGFSSSLFFQANTIIFRTPKHLFCVGQIPAS